MVYAMISIGVLGFIVWSQMAPNLYSIEFNYFAICQDSSTLQGTLYSKNLYNYTKLAGNLKNYTSSSETKRKEIFNFDQFFKIYGKNIDTDWLIWFIGFSEGDGSISVYNNKLRFVITQKEGDILYHIQKTLAIGKVTKNKDNYYRYSIHNQQEILKLVYIFNGNLVIPYRIKQLSFWLSILIQLNYNIIFIDQPVYPSFNDPWISGFTDAEGCFNVMINKRKESKLGVRIILRYILDQNNFYNNFKHIRSLFNGGFIQLRSSKNKNEHYRFTINTFHLIELIIIYFDTFPLKTMKYKNYELWKKIYKKILDKNHLTEEGLKNIKILKKEININNSLTKKIGHSLKF